MWKRVGGTDTALGTGYANTLAPTTARVVKFSVVGSSLTLNVDGTDVQTVSDTALTAKGSCGSWNYFSDIGDVTYLEDWSASDAAAAGLPFFMQSDLMHGGIQRLDGGFQ